LVGRGHLGTLGSHRSIRADGDWTHVLLGKAKRWKSETSLRHVMMLRDIPPFGGSNIEWGSKRPCQRRMAHRHTNACTCIRTHVFTVAYLQSQREAMRPSCRAEKVDNFLDQAWCYSGLVRLRSLAASLPRTPLSCHQILSLRPTTNRVPAHRPTHATTSHQGKEVVR
jgi:hypothetical protein